MKFLTVLTFALAALVLAVQGEMITVRGHPENDKITGGNYNKGVFIETDDQETVGKIGVKLCQLLHGLYFENAIVKDISNHDELPKELVNGQTLKDAGFVDGGRLMVKCLSQANQRGNLKGWMKEMIKEGTN